jgi:predicted DNA-binding transcriptional regulator AlpA
MNNANKDNLNLIPEPLLLRAKEAARLCGIALSTWYEFKSAGMLPPSIKLGKARLWRLDVLRRWVEWDCPNIDKFMALERSCQKK